MLLQLGDKARAIVVARGFAGGEEQERIGWHRHAALRPLDRKSKSEDSDSKLRTDKGHIGYGVGDATLGAGVFGFEYVPAVIASLFEGLEGSHPVDFGREFGEQAVLVFEVALRDAGTEDFDSRHADAGVVVLFVGDVVVGADSGAVDEPEEPVLVDRSEGGFEAERDTGV